MSDRVFVDTNVLAYLFDDDEPVKGTQAQTLIAATTDAGVELVISTQVLQELYWCLTRKFRRPVTPKTAEAAVRWAARWTVVLVDCPLVFEAITASQKHGLAFWDALIVGAALRGGCTRLLTEDLQHGQAFGRLRIENPFRAPQAHEAPPPRRPTNLRRARTPLAPR